LNTSARGMKKLRPKNRKEFNGREIDRAHLLFFLFIKIKEKKKLPSK
jgi:hypothetical protein